MSAADQPSEQTAQTGQQFATTHWSVVLTARQGHSAQALSALETLCRAYWQPIYSFLRRERYEPEEARDLTQGFFARLLAQDFLSQIRRERGKFRSFLLGALKHYVADERDKARAQKRGGGAVIFSLDDRAKDFCAIEPADRRTPETIFEHRWAVALLEHAFARLRDEYVLEGKAALFEQLQSHLAGETKSGDYDLLAKRLSMTPNAVAVAVHRLRQRYREVVRQEIAHTVATPAEIDDEMRHLFAVIAS